MKELSHFINGAITGFALGASLTIGIALNIYLKNGEDLAQPSEMLQDKRYTLTNRLTIVVRDIRNIQRDYGRSVRGIYLPEKRELHVPYSNQKDKNGNNVPYFHTLGHETWHAPELGNAFHGGTNW